jgi:hypothetical protein
MTGLNDNKNELYERFPRFVDEAHLNTGKETDIYETEFEWNDRTFSVSIIPAQIRCRDKGNIVLLPGRQEKAVEDALLIYAAKDPNLCPLKDGITFHVDDLASVILSEGHSAFTGEQEIERSLRILKGAAYQVTYDGRELWFNSLAELTRMESKNGNVFSIRLSTFVLAGDVLFNDFFPGG